MSTSGFHDVQFPPGISYGAVGGPGFSTTIVEFANGREQRNQNWANGLCAWDVSHGVRTATEYNALLAFFRARKGRAFGFRFKDWSDYTAVHEVFGTGDGTTLTFQLAKNYISGSGSEKRLILKPVSAIIYLNGVSTSSYLSTDLSTGIVTFSVGHAPGAGVVLSWSGEFDVPVRFDSDQMKVSMDDFNQFSWGQIMLRETMPY